MNCQEIFRSFLLFGLFVVAVHSSFAQQPRQNESSGEKITVFTIGDSTMANKKAEVAPETGWCQAFSTFVDSSVLIKNRAMNGRSTKSFIAELRWKAILEGYSQIIQFTD